MERDEPKSRPVVQRGDPRMKRSQLDGITDLRKLLEDVYKDAGDGRTLVRELVQNADDACAERLVFVVLDHGWKNARNTLLRGPGLLIANDGPFPARDQDGLHRAVGGSKGADTGKVGRFGVGFKSVFHICEAIVYVGADGNTLRPGALNPWAGTGDDPVADPLHPDWDKVSYEEASSLVEAATLLLGRFHDGLLVWVPFRRSDHLNRAEGRPHGLGQVCPSPEDVVAWFGRSTSLALLLAQCGYLQSIEAGHACDPSSLAQRTQLARLVRPGFDARGWVGRHEDDSSAPDRPFHGTIDDEGAKGAAQRWRVDGVEALGLPSLRELRDHPDWPRYEENEHGRLVSRKRKALAHAAVTIVRGDGLTAALRGARARWAVFLPLDDDPEPRSSGIVEQLSSSSVHDAWEILLHGYFWPSHDRRSIPGVTDDDKGAGAAAMRVRWNRAVRDELLLPLLPSALAPVLCRVSQEEARGLVGAVANSRVVRQHPAVTNRHVLIPTLTEDGVRWESRERGGLRILALPEWCEAPTGVRKGLAAAQTACSPGVVFIDGGSPRIGGEPDRWLAAEVDLVLKGIQASSLRNAQDVAWAGKLVRQVRATGAEPECLARWVAQRFADGVLARTTDNKVPKAERADLRRAGWELAAALPNEWLLVQTRHGCGRPARA
jgi:hypothetical protein